MTAWVSRSAMVLAGAGAIVAVFLWAWLSPAILAPEPSGASGGSDRAAERRPSGHPVALPDFAPAAVLQSSELTEHRTMLDRHEIESRELPWTPLGDVPDDLMRSMLEGLSGLHRQASQAKLDLLVQSQSAVDSLALADLEVDIEGADAKSNALLERSYLLVPEGHELPHSFRVMPDLHVVLAPGGEKGGVKFSTFILIDLQRHGRFSEAMKVRARRKDEIQARIVERFMQFSAYDRDKVTASGEGPEELVRLWAEMQAQGLSPDPNRK